MKVIMPIATFILLLAIGSIIVITDPFNKIPDEYALGLFVVLILTCLFSLIFFPDFFYETNKGAFKKAMEKILLRASPDYDEIILLKERYKLQIIEVEKILLEIYSEKMQSEGKNAETVSLRKMIETIREDKPFANLPDSIRTRLVELTPSDNLQKENIKKLAGSITDFIVKGERQQRIERRKSTISIAIGILGLLITFLTFRIK